MFIKAIIFFCVVSKSMKLQRCTSPDPADRLKANLRRAVLTLKSKESSALVDHIVHDVAHLTTVYGQRRLRDEFENIISLSKDFTTDVSTNCSCETCSSCYPESDSGRTVHQKSDEEWDNEDVMHAANADLLSKMNAMRSAIIKMEEKQQSEIQKLQAEKDRYKELLVDTERKLIKERLLNQKLRESISRTTRAGHNHSHGEYGYGALTVRSCDSASHRSTSPIACRPKSAVRHG